jgi:hypothetical protein
MRSVRATLDTLSPPDLADLCPRLAVVGPTGTVPGLGFAVDAADRPLVASEERVLLRASALVRVHAAVDDVGGRPLRHADGAGARLLAVAAGAGPMVVTDRRVAGVLRAAPSRPRLAYALVWEEIDDVGPAPSGGVCLLSTRLVGALTLDPLT